MKRAVAFSFLLACCGFLLADSPAVSSSDRRVAVLDEIARLSHSGATDDMVLAYVRAHRQELPSRLSDDDIRWLRQSGVSEKVVRYLWAVDVRLADGSSPEGVTYGPGEAAPRPYDQYPPEGESNGGYPDNGYVGYDSPSGPYEDNGFYNYWPTPYFNSWYSYYPYSSYPYYYPYYPFYAFNRYGFHGHGHDGHHHGNDGHHGDGGHGHHGNVGHGGSADGWRDRGSVARRGGPMTAGPRGSASQSFSRGNFAAAPRGSRGGVVSRGGPGRGAFSGGSPRGSVGSRGSVAPRGSTAGHGGYAHGGFSGGHSGGAHSGGGGGHSGGGHSGGGSTGGHGRR